MMYPNDMDLETRRTVFIRKLVCWYLACAALTYAARKEMHIETRVISPKYPLMIEKRIFCCCETRLGVSSTYEVPGQSLGRVSEKRDECKILFSVTGYFRRSRQITRMGVVKVYSSGTDSVSTLSVGSKYCTSLTTSIGMYGGHRPLRRRCNPRRRQIGNNAGLSHLARD